MNSPIHVEVQDRIVTLTLNRPDKLNAIVPEMADGFREALRKAAEPGTKGLVLRGEGRGFCAGGDLGWLVKHVEAGNQKELEALLDLGVEVAHGLRTLPKPALALIQGPCAGAGMSLALGADLRVAATDAKFSMAFVKVGLHPDWGGSVMLHLAAGPSVAAHLMLTADAVDAARAKELGLVHEVVDPEMLADVRKVWAQRLAQGPGEAMARIKASALRNAGFTPDSLLALLKAEGEQMKAAIRSADALEGMQAFLEKRAPKFA
ncbi:MAG TPA: enoyl-CoA hydratase-related protein [Holophagaceae bacterium]|nr:enoyl-CoA hydratase-related protein [Holophagaceae bacterium]